MSSTFKVIATLQNEVVSFNSITLNWLLMVGIAGQAAGIGLFWLVQRRYQISTQAMLLFVAFWILFLNLWGVIGCGTTKIGYHNQWEFWFYQGVTYGVLACPWYAYSQVSKRGPLTGPCADVWPNSTTLAADNDQRSRPPRQRIPLLQRL